VKPLGKAVPALASTGGILQTVCRMHANQVVFPSLVDLFNKSFYDVHVSSLHQAWCILVCLPVMCPQEDHTGMDTVEGD
jgi:hypothetical protein